MTAEPKLHWRDLDYLQVTLPWGPTVYARHRRDLPIPGLFEFRCACGREIRYWQATMSAAGWLDVQDVTAKMRETLPRRMIEARMRAHVAGQKKRQALVQAALSEPDDWQEAHDPTRRTVLRDYVENKGRRILISAKRRLFDARLWDSLSSEQQDAAHLIVKGYMISASGLGLKRAKYQPREIIVAEAMDWRSRAAQHGGGQDWLFTTFWRWVERAQRGGVSVAAVLDVLANGYSCAETDRAHRRRHGWAKAQVADGLNIYVEVMGRAPHFG